MSFYNVRIYRNYGPVAFSADTTIDLTPEALEGTTPTVEIAKALTALSAIHDVYAAEYAPKVQPSQLQTSAQAVEPRIEPAEIIHKEFSKGKWLYKVHGGSFKQYGVMIWKEVLEAADIALESIPDAGLPLTDAKMVIEMKGRNPWKVLKLDIGQPS
jgi:hypothetical protein